MAWGHAYVQNKQTWWTITRIHDVSWEMSVDYMATSVLKKLKLKLSALLMLFSKTESSKLSSNKNIFKISKF